MKIYLIGGPPKCGKTTLSKALATEKNIPYLSTDSLESVLQYYLPSEDFHKNILKGDSNTSNDEFYNENSVEAIKESYILQGKTSYKAIRSMVETSLIEQDSIILEGFHITPEIVHDIVQEFGGENIQSVFLIKTDVDNFLQDIHKSLTPNDWILQKTKEEATFMKIAEMITSYSQYFQEQAEKYNLDYINMDTDFLEKIEEYIN